MNSFRPRTIIDYLQIIWRRKLIIFLFSSAVMIAVYYAILPVRNIYEAKALIAITMPSNDEKGGMDVQLASVNQNLLSRANLESIVVRYNLYNNKSGIDAAINQLRRDLNIDTKLRDYYPQFPVSFTIIYKHIDPSIAMKVTNDVASYFDATNVEVEKRSVDEINALVAATTELERQLKLMNQQRIATELSTGNHGIIKAQRASLISAIESLNDKEFGLNQRIHEQKRQLREQESLIKAMPRGFNESAHSSAYGVLLTEKARLEAQLKDQKTQYTEKNQKVIQTQSQIAEIVRQLAQMSNKEDQPALNATSSISQEMRTLQREQASLETELELTQRDLKRKRQALALLPEADVTSAEIAAAGVNSNDLKTGESNLKDAANFGEYNLLFNRYSSLMEKLDSLKRLRGGTGNVSGLFQIVDKAVMPTVPVGPNKIKLMLIGFVLALSIGLIAAIVAELPRLLTVQDQRDIEYLFGSPVIGLIPETLTPTESRHNRKLFLVRVLSTLLFAGALIPFLIVILNKVQLFQILAK